MGGIMLLPESGMKTTTWSGGTTTELFLWPKDGSYAERRFNIRISSALVDLEESSFTPLPGVKRFLTPLCAGFELSINGGTKLLPRGEVLEFSGSDEVLCRGRGRDLNLMLKGAEGDMRIVSGAFTVEEGGFAFAYGWEEGAVSYCAGRRCTSALIPEGAFARLAPGEYHSNGRIVLFTASVPEE